jgi:hypothetical protein
MNRKILDNILTASKGDESALTLLYEGLIEGPLYVPRRFQAQRMTDQPAYPSDLVDVLGLAEGDRVVVPVFADAGAIEQWCGNKLLYREMNGKRLAEAIPDGWWAVLSPGSEGEKDLSPWELEQLRAGVQAVPALIAELRDAEIVEPLEVAPAQGEEYAALRDALLEYCKAHEEIERLWVLKESGLDLEERRVTRVLIGAELGASVGGTQLETITAELRATADRAQIGGDAAKVFVGSGRDALILGAFRGAEPLYAGPKKTGIFARIFAGARRT